MPTPARRLAPLLAAALAGCAPAATRPAPDPARAAPLPSGTRRWTIDDLHTSAGHPTTVLGQPAVVPSPVGNAVQFDGVDDGLILPVAPLAGLPAFTLEILFYPASGGPREQRFLHSEDDAGTRVTIETRLTPQGEWSLDTFLRTNASQRALLDETKRHPADRWYWVALRYENGTMTSFINGQKELEGAVTFTPMHAAGRVSLGVRLNQVSWFKGMIREVRVTPAAQPDAALQKIP
jgi:hypothetical protein